ncbi:hypothetical protein Bhyg_16017 [Pseudolycoriella hygida]|uniref:ER-bound oxygenase mpaB/mpaB'/Rubber oxygenase catalytic domain-containing protein n=1 Tax=Pseudolycoriella hygida TaxID=35572 RepID=A0A9Q0MKF7_9DIPT|nr:hypothetical protein Bhyg_16017 [Pseudolycoriella hygida]
MAEERILTSSEIEAKRYMQNLLTGAFCKPCDIGAGNDCSAILPDWYDEVKFKRGQKYFLDNRFGMLLSNLYGLYTLLADPKGLDVLDSTGKSSTADTAKKRYVSTIVNMLMWYKDDLHPNSKSWKSLLRVRKMHFSASNSAFKKEIGLITQFEICITTFGFIGFAILRPQFLGIRCNDTEGREGFIHFWAVIGHMLGVEDEFNMCLFNVETVEKICLILLRYVFIPLIQLETPKFKGMMESLVTGLSSFLPHMSYNVQMFMVKRIIGVPGYQYCVDLAKEKICPQMFTSEEINAVKEIVRPKVGKYMELYEIVFHDAVPILASQINGSVCHNRTINCVEVGDKKFNWIMRRAGIDSWKIHLNDSKLYTLSKWEQITVRWYCLILTIYKNRVGRCILEMALNFILSRIQRHYDSHNIKLSRVEIAEGPKKNSET